MTLKSLKNRVVKIFCFLNGFLPVHDAVVFWSKNGFRLFGDLAMNLSRETAAKQEKGQNKPIYYPTVPAFHDCFRNFTLNLEN
jgi:hypothetical protein